MKTATFKHSSPAPFGNGTVSVYRVSEPVAFGGPDFFGVTYYLAVSSVTAQEASASGRRSAYDTTMVFPCAPDGTTVNVDGAIGDEGLHLDSERALRDLGYEITAPDEEIDDEIWPPEVPTRDKQVVHVRAERLRALTNAGLDSREFDRGLTVLGVDLVIDSEGN
jgi:hypothetical protein